MSSSESQEKVKEEAKAIRERLETLIKDKDTSVRTTRMTCIYAGLLTETLLDFEEPDVVMEQAFHRIADLLRTDPSPVRGEELIPPAYVIDHDTELGRHLARNVAERLPRGIDDIHEIAIALIINDFPAWEKKGPSKEESLRLLIESVIMSLTFEMATQDFCDLLIEDFIAEGARTAGEGILALAAVAGHYYALAETEATQPADAEQELTNVMIRESLRHGTPGPKDWKMLAPANDTHEDDIPEYISALKPDIEEFFVMIGLDNRMAQAVAIAKAVGRMVAVITVEDVGQIHPSIAKSLAKTGMILGSKYKDDGASR